MAEQIRAGGKKSKHKITKPAKRRYWLARHLENRKIKRMLKNHQSAKKGGKPMTKAQCTEYWNKIRKGRVPDGYFKQGD